MTRLIAFYLPQFYPTPENDAWWGKDFTEWTHVKAAKPLFSGHRQPRLPTDLGYYDLRDVSSRDEQYSLAREFGVYGFCLWHFWSMGRRLLDGVEQSMLGDKNRLPYCLCWANESWTKCWDGLDDDVIWPQEYSAADDILHFRYLVRFLRDPMVIHVDRKPMILVYRADRHPDPRGLVLCWREEAARTGLRGIHLVAVERADSLPGEAVGWGFDACVRFQPNAFTADMRPLITPAGIDAFDYADTWRKMAIDRRSYNHPRYETICVGMDNTPRRGRNGSTVLQGSTPEEYGEWLRSEILRASYRQADHQLVFINSWNEWGGGSILEPCSLWGRGYLEATREALKCSDAHS